jgi:hypothetical protein
MTRNNDVLEGKRNIFGTTCAQTDRSIIATVDELGNESVHIHMLIYLHLRIHMQTHITAHTTRTHLLAEASTQARKHASTTTRTNLDVWVCLIMHRTVRCAESENTPVCARTMSRNNVGNSSSINVSTRARSARDKKHKTAQASLATDDRRSCDDKTRKNPNQRIRAHDRDQFNRKCQRTQNQKTPDEKKKKKDMANPTQTTTATTKNNSKPNNNNYSKHNNCNSRLKSTAKSSPPEE